MPHRPVRPECALANGVVRDVTVHLPGVQLGILGPVIGIGVVEESHSEQLVA